MSNQQLGRRARMGFLQQSKGSNHWGTNQAISANFKTFNFEPGFNVNPGVSVEQFNQSGSYGLHEEAERKFIDKYADLPTVAFSGLANKALLAPLLVAAMQACSEGASTPFAKTITSGFLGNGIDWANNEGFLYTIAIENFNDGLYTQGGYLKDALLNDLTIEVDVNNKGVARLARVSGTWIGSKYEELDPDGPFTGTWVAKPSNDLVYNGNSAFTVGINTTNYVNTNSPKTRFAIKLNNNITADLKGAGGLPGNYKANPKWTVEIDLPYFANNNSSSLQTPRLLKSYLNGDNLAINIETGSAGVDGHLKFAIPYSVMSQQPISDNGDYKDNKLVLDMLSAAGATPMTVTMSDAIDWGL